MEIQMSWHWFVDFAPQVEGGALQRTFWTDPDFKEYSR